MEKITDVREGVIKLLTIREHDIPEFSIEPRKEGEFVDTFIWDGKKIPVFNMLYDPRIYQMQNWGKRGDNSALNVYSYYSSDVTLEECIYRELVIAEALLHSKIKKITAYINKSAANMIVLMEDESCANIDLGNTMAPGTINQCQHKLITKHGMANDRAVGTTVTCNQVNFFRSDSTDTVYYNDDLYYLYGMSEPDVAKAIAIHAILTGLEKAGDWTERDERCRAGVKAVFESDKRGGSVMLSEVL